MKTCGFHVRLSRSPLRPIRPSGPRFGRSAELEDDQREHADYEDQDSTVTDLPECQFLPYGSWPLAGRTIARGAVLSAYDERNGRDLILSTCHRAVAPSTINHGRVVGSRKPSSVFQSHQTRNIVVYRCVLELFHRCCFSPPTKHHGHCSTTCVSRWF